MAQPTAEITVEEWRIMLMALEQSLVKVAEAQRVLLLVEKVRARCGTVNNS